MTLHGVSVPEASAAIADLLLGADTATLDIQSIPQTYDHLLCLFQVRSNNAVVSQRASLTLNGATGASDYVFQQHYGTGTTNTSAADAGDPSIYLVDSPGSSATAGLCAGGFFWIPNYAQTTFHKLVHATVHGITAANAIYAMRVEGRYAATTAVSRITLTPAAGSWLTGSRFSLYGIA